MIKYEPLVLLSKFIKYRTIYNLKYNTKYSCFISNELNNLLLSYFYSIHSIILGNAIFKTSSCGM